MRTHPGFIAALDQSGGSTPGALRAYGIKENAWSNEEEMFAIVHQMRTRIMTSPVFTGERIIGAILFENTMDRDVEGQPTADYLWNVKRVVPFLKVDKGLAAESRRRPADEADARARRAARQGQGQAHLRNQDALVHQAGRRRRHRGHRDPAVRASPGRSSPRASCRSSSRKSTSTARTRREAEELLKAAILEELNGLPAGQLVMLKLTLPEKDDLYAELVTHPKVVRVVALSGGYTQEEGNRRLRRNHGVVASFSRALVEGLSAQQSDAEYNARLDASIQSIFEASNT